MDRKRGLSDEEVEQEIERLNRSEAVRISCSRSFSSWVMYRSPFTNVCLRMYVSGTWSLKELDTSM